MIGSAKQLVPPGAMRLTVPPGYRAYWLSEHADAERVQRWSETSPEGSLYNTPAYVRFARARNGRAELLWLAREGNPVLGLPLHPLGGPRVGTGYSGAMFPEGPREATLRRGVEALTALLAANRRLGFELLQCAQAPAYDDPARLASLACLLATQGFRGPSLYSRMLELGPLAGGPSLAPDLSVELLLEHGLEPYQAELRSQIRQALRNGLRVTCSLPHSETEAHAVYSEFTPLHHESWGRTGMDPHPLEYWMELTHAIVESGGRDLIVYVRTEDGKALAAVICHLRASRALYWAGASREQGLDARANPLCLHAAIQACRQLGVRHFELGRFDARESSPKELAVTRYKAQFGGELVRIVGFKRQPPLAARVLDRARLLPSGARLCQLAQRTAATVRQ
jgi:hypothetical protein